jgi:hypothetical protein
LSNATENTLVRRFHNPSSTNPGLAKLCTISDEDCIPTFQPVD